MSEEPALETSPLPGGSAPGRSVSRRRFLHLATSAAAGVGLSACAGTRLGARPETGKVQLVYQDWRTEWFPALAQEMLGQFHETHPNIRVFYVPDPENLEDKMLADMQAGAAPDVFQGCCSHFPIWAQKGYCLDLRSFANADLDKETVDDWDPAQYRALFLPDGSQFGLPKYHGALALYYNKDYFDELGVAYPDASWTHDDYATALRRLTLDRSEDRLKDVYGSMVDISWERLQVHVNAWGGHFVDPADSSHCMMAAPESLAALEWLRYRIVEEHTMPSSLAVQKMTTRDAFAAGRLAMVEDGSWALKDVLQKAQFRVGVAPFPAGPVKRATLATTDGFGIYANSRHPEAAWELVKFLVSKDYGRAMARAHLLQPARASLVDEWGTFVRQAFPTRAADLDITAFADGHVKGYSVTAETFANMADATQLAGRAWERIFTYGEQPVDSLHEVCRQIEEAQEKPEAPGGVPCC